MDLKNILPLAVLAVVASQSSFVIADSQEEIDKQIAKLIGDTIASRIVSDIVEAEIDSAQSEDTTKNLYGAFTQLAFEIDLGGFDTGGFDTGGFGSKFDIDVYLLGYDKKISDVTTLGVSFNTSSSIGDEDAPFGISPYAAYILNDNYFITTTFTYTDAGSDTFSALALGLNRLYLSEDQRTRLTGRFNIGSSDVDDWDRQNWVLQGGIKKTINDANDLHFTGDLSISGDLNDNDSNPIQGSIGISKSLGTKSSVSFSYGTFLDADIEGDLDIELDVWTLAGQFSF